MQFTPYKSTDAAAPVLSGTAGALVAILDACLVTGYGTQPAAGWTKVWQNAGNTIAIYKPNSAPDFFLKIDDSAALAALGREAAVSAGTAHDGAGNLTNAAPQNTGLASGYAWRKSTSTTAVARAWKLWADDKTLIFSCTTGDTTAQDFPYYAGRIAPLWPGDAYPYALNGRVTHNSTSNASSAAPGAYCPITNATHAGATSPLRADGAPASVSFRYAAPVGFTTSTTPALWGAIGDPAPGPISGVWPFFDGALFHHNEPRGRLRGLIFPLFSGGAAAADTITVDLDGVARTYRAAPLGASGLFFVEESATLAL